MFTQTQRELDTFTSMTEHLHLEHNYLTLDVDVGAEAKLIQDGATSWIINEDVYLYISSVSHPDYKRVIC